MPDTRKYISPDWHPDLPSKLVLLEMLEMYFFGSWASDTHTQPIRQRGLFRSPWFVPNLPNA